VLRFNHKQKRRFIPEIKGYGGDIMWDYAKLAQIAKECGGPELFMKGLVQYGKDQMKPTIFVTGAICAFVGGVGGIGLYKLKKKLDEKRIKKKIENMSPEELSLLIQSINDKHEIEHKNDD
jgi:hypothetical protein